MLELDSLSPSQLSVWQECEVKWKYAYVDKMKPMRGRVVAFEKGSYIHELMHYYYQLVKQFGLKNPIVLQSVMRRIKDDLDAHAEECLEHEVIPDFQFYRDCSKTMSDYIQMQSQDIDKGITDIEIESHLEYEYDGRSFHGYVDLLYKDANGKWHIRDHKSGAKNTYSNQYVERVEQLLFYGTLFWKLRGIVAIPEISFIHSTPPSKPKVGTVLFGLFSAQHTEHVYETYWNHLVRIHERQKNSQIEHNYSSCKYCPYWALCRADLRGYSAENIIKYRFRGTIQNKDSASSSSSETGFTLNLGGRKYHY